MLKRYVKNPILMARADLAWCSKKVYNAAVFKDTQVYHMLFRAVGDDWISRLGRADSTDGVNFIMQQEPTLSPLMPWEQRGCEDPRMTKIGTDYLVAYTAFDGITARAVLTSSTDLINWSERRLLFPEHTHVQREDLPDEWSKAAALFSKKIHGKYWLLYGDNHIWPATSHDLKLWQPSKIPLLSAREGYFDAAYVEMGPPPIWTEQGWLVFYHGVDEFSEKRIYSLGAALLDLENPTNVLWRTSKPILVPTHNYETVGFIDIVAGGFATLQRMSLHNIIGLAQQKKLPKAIFCCGAVMEQEIVRLYYGAADTVICEATIDLVSLFKH